MTTDINPAHRTPRPNPGSQAAIDLGCRCPVMDNNRGQRAPYQPDGWWINSDCPVHGGGTHALDREAPDAEHTLREAGYVPEPDGTWRRAR